MLLGNRKHPNAKNNINAYLFNIYRFIQYFCHIASVSIIFCQSQIWGDSLFSPISFNTLCVHLWFYGLVRALNLSTTASWNKFQLNPPLFPLCLGVGLFVYWENKENNTFLPTPQRLRLSCFLLSALIDSCTGLWAVFNFFVCSHKSLHTREREGQSVFDLLLCVRVCVFFKSRR